MKTESPDNLTLFAGDAEDILDYRNGYIKDATVDVIFTDPTPPKNVTDILKLCRVFNKAKRVLKPTGCILVVMADFHDEKGSLELTPFTFAKQMKERYGWIVRSAIIGHRPAENATEAFLKAEDHNRFLRDYDFLFFFTLCRFGYYWNPQMLKFPLKSTISVTLDRVKPGEFATGFPKQLIKELLHITCPPGGMVMDTHAGTGTTGLVALQNGYRFIGIDKNPQRIPMMWKRLHSYASYQNKLD